MPFNHARAASVHSAFIAAIAIVARRRPWFRRETHNYVLHPSIDVMFTRGYVPADWHQLLLEWPHVATTDPARIAYTRDERAGAADRQTLTSVGKYLMRHYGHEAPEHVIRDVAALTVTQAQGVEYVISDDNDLMCYAADYGPASCMSETGIHERCHHPVPFTSYTPSTHHCYKVYDPMLGWRIAVRYEWETLSDGAQYRRITGRALLFKDYFVRCYKYQHESSYSGNDDALRTWLQEQGKRSVGAWTGAGALFKYIPYGSNFLAPYLDGDDKYVHEDHVTVNGITVRVLRIEDSGPYKCDNTNGEPDESGHQCEDCGAHEDEDEGTYVGRHGDRFVCSSCIDNYTHAYGRYGHEYWVESNEAVEVDGEYYHVDYLSDNDIVCLEDGEYCHSDNACYDDHRGEWFRDDECVYVDSRGQSYYQDDVWQCECTGKYYHCELDEDVRVEINGYDYHVDSPTARDHAESETEEQE